MFACYCCLFLYGRGILDLVQRTRVSNASGIHFVYISVIKVAHLDVKVGILADDDNIAGGLVHRTDTISVYVNAFTYSNTFRNLNFATEAVLKQGARIVCYAAFFETTLKGHIDCFPLKSSYVLENRISLFHTCF